MRKRSDKTVSLLASLSPQNTGDQSEGTADQELASGEDSRARGGLEGRLDLLREVHHGRRAVTHYSATNVRLDPAVCRPWRFHDRELESLSAISCADLIDGFKEAGRQIIPGMVRPLVNNPEGVQFEVLVGVRRWWVCQHLGWQFEAEIKQQSDGEAFLASDVENRSRSDISDWERAWKYRRALADIYSAEGVAAGRSAVAMTQRELAAKLGQSETWLTRLLDLTDLPEEIVLAFPSRREIRVNHGRRLKPYLENTEAKARVVRKAIEIANGEPKSAVAVMSALEKAGKATPKGSERQLATYVGAKGALAVRVMRKGRRDLRIEIVRGSIENLEEARRLVMQAVDEHFQ
jgi:ParB family transcriptional regulator, chromosome partitioning protein